MSDVMLTLDKDGYRYVAVIDHDAYYHTFDSPHAMDFEDEADKEAYRKKFERQEITGYGVIKQEACTCCNEYKDVDSLWGIHAIDAEQAIEYYINY